MYNSLKTVFQIQSATPPLSEWLTTVGDYLAHTKPGKKSESFSEHVYLVNGYFEKLCKAHGLDSVIDGSGLIAFICKEKLIDKQTDCCVVNHD